MLLVRRLRRRHPLERGTLVCRRDLDFDVDGLAFGYSGWECDGERAAVRFYAVANCELGALAVDLDDGDVQEAGIY